MRSMQNKFAQVRKANMAALAENEKELKETKDELKKHELLVYEYGSRMMPGKNNILSGGRHLIIWRPPDKLGHLCKLMRICSRLFIRKTHVKIQSRSCVKFHHTEDYIVFYAVSAIFRPYNGGHTKVSTKLGFI